MIAAVHHPRVLICGPVFRLHRVGGLRDVLHDLASGLREAGWQVDTLLDLRNGDEDDRSQSDFALKSQAFVAAKSRILGLPRVWRLIAGLLLPTKAYARRFSAELRAAERQIEQGHYDVVVACVDSSPLGLASLVTRIHPRHVLVSLPAVSKELVCRRWLAVIGPVARHLTGRWCHRDLYSPFNPSKARLVVFASHSWRNDAVAAGLPVEHSRVIHFGVAIPDRLKAPTPVAMPARLLSAARLEPEKGLHLFLPALARLRHDLPFRLTIVAGEGATWYRKQIECAIRSLGLDDVVTFQQPVPRAKLPGVLAAHDVLLFYSKFAEPVAQMLLLAFAHGLVVVGASAGKGRSTLISDDTAFCFGDASAPVVAGAIRHAVTDLAKRARVRARAHELARSEHSLAVTIAKYDAVLADVATRPPDPLQAARHSYQAASRRLA